MTKFTTFFFFLLFTSFKSYCQESISITTKTQAIEWFDSLKKQSIEVQLKMISQRIVSDTGIHFTDSQTTKKIITKQDTSIGALRCVSSLYHLSTLWPILLMSPDITILITNNTNKQKLIELSKLLTTDNVREIYFLQNASSEALYGIYGVNGTIILKLKKKHFAKKFKKLNLEGYS